MAKAKSPATTTPKTEAKPAVARKKTAASSVVAAPAAKPTAPSRAVKQPTASGKQISAEQRANYIEVAAFYIAERRGFTLGNPVEDWLAAEAEIDRLLATGRLG